MPEAAAETLPSPALTEGPMGFQDCSTAAATEAARVEAARPEAARAGTARGEVARIEIARLQAPKADTVAEGVAKAQAARNAAQIDTRRTEPKAATSVAASRRAAAAVFIVAATGLGVSAYWFNFQGRTNPDHAHPTSVAPTAAVAERVSASPNPRPAARATPRAREIAAARDRAIPAKTTAAPKAASATSSGARPRVPPKAGRQPTAPTPLAASVPAPAGVTEAPASEAAPPQPVTAALPPPASAAPVLPFFEAKDVNESPRVTSRVEPQLPDTLQAHELNDVVVVRLLVSQSGHPSSFSLLRRSRAGPSLDEAVVAAVKQWRFLPARKKGEAVSCWYNVGVPVRRAN